MTERLAKIKRAGDAANPGKAKLKFVPPAFLSSVLPREHFTQ